jgi:hypothetical protein
MGPIGRDKVYTVYETAKILAVGDSLFRKGPPQNHKKVPAPDGE